MKAKQAERLYRDAEFSRIKLGEQEMFKAWRYPAPCLFCDGQQLLDCAKYRLGCVAYIQFKRTYSVTKRAYDMQYVGVMPGELSPSELDKMQFIGYNRRKRRG